MLKGTRLHSILFNKCPRCHEGNFFNTNNPYNLKQFDKMPDECPVCGEKYEREIGFYYGAMYVNYALTVAAGVAWFILVYLFYGFDPMVYSVPFTILLIVLIPWMFRTGRLTWISFFVKYDPSALKRKKQN